ncbi:MAG: amidohydrolase family protein [Terriglobia bacterium]
MKIRTWSLLVLAALVAGASAPRIRAQKPAPSLESVAPIDAHAHAFNTSPEFYKLFDRLNLRFLNICVVDKHERGFADGEWQHKTALEVRRISHGRAAWCSTFDPQDWESPGFAERTIKLLNETFDQGAVAVKIYKSIGMELKTKSGEYLMPDNPVFDPIMEDIAKHNRTVVAHIAEPTSAWLPLDPSSPDYSYYKTYPEWHNYLHPERPSKGTILAARDRLVKRHPKLRFVGAHLGSMEVDVDEIARHFDLYPNFAVDTAARIPYLMIQPREKVRAFLIKYQDRVLYATDLVFMPWDNPAETAKNWEAEYARDWKFFSTDETLTYNHRTVRGLALPAPVLKKLYHDNAIKWIPGLSNSKP